MERKLSQDSKGLNVPSQFPPDTVSSRFDGVISICCHLFFFLEASLGVGALMCQGFSLLGTPAGCLGGKGLPHLISAG